MLNREFQYSRILHCCGLNDENSGIEEIGPCLRALSEKVVDNLCVVDVDIANAFAFIQGRQDGSIDSLNLEKAVMDRCGWCLIGIGSLQVNASVSRVWKTRRVLELLLGGSREKIA